MSNIINLPTAEVLALRTSTNLATALEKQLFRTDMFSFMGNEVQKEYLAAPKRSTVRVEIKPQLSEAVNITQFSETELVTADYDRASYGSIEVKLDYACAKRFTYPSSNLSFVPDKIEVDYTSDALRKLFLRMKRTINSRLKTSPLAQTIGTVGTPINEAALFELRILADSQGYQDVEIEIRLPPRNFALLAKNPDLKDYIEFVPFGNNGVVKTNAFYLRGMYNMKIVADNTYTITTPASEPAATAYTAQSAVVPMRGVEVGDPDKDYKMFDADLGINVLFQKETKKVNIGRVVECSLEFFYGFKELSADINSAGIIQSVPIWNINGKL